MATNWIRDCVFIRLNFHFPCVVNSKVAWMHNEYRSWWNFIERTSRDCLACSSKIILKDEKICQSPKIHSFKETVLLKQRKCRQLSSNDEKRLVKSNKDKFSFSTYNMRKQENRKQSKRGNVNINYVISNDVLCIRF